MDPNAELPNEVPIRFECKVCKYPTIKKQNILTCFKCCAPLHFHCTRLPPYMIYTLSRSSRMYVCEECTATPKSFLLDLIHNNSVNIDFQKSHENEVDKYGNIDNRINGMDIPSSEEFDLDAMGNKMLLPNTQITYKLPRKQDGSNVHVNKIDDDSTQQNKDGNQKTEVDDTKDEDKSMRTSNDMLIGLINEKDRQLKEIIEEKENLCKVIDHQNELLRCRQMIIKKMDKLCEHFRNEKETNVKLRDSIMNTQGEVIKRDEKIASLTERVVVCISMLESQQENLKILTEQPEEVNTRSQEFNARILFDQSDVSNEQDLTEPREESYSKMLTEQCNEFNSLHLSGKPQESNRQTLSHQQEESEGQVQDIETNLDTKITKQKRTMHKQNAANNFLEDSGNIIQTSANGDRPNVIILHDSLCNDINESIMSREKITTKKILTPSLAELIKRLDEIKDADVIVIQALASSLQQFSSDEINKQINETICNALTKARKVIICTMIAREDEEMLSMKANLVNENIKCRYMNEPNVVICNNENLNDDKFRVDDGVNLTPHGTSLLAVNIKKKIAEALNIEVFKKLARKISNRLRT